MAGEWWVNRIEMVDIVYNRYVCTELAISPLTLNEMDFVELYPIVKLDEGHSQAAHWQHVRECEVLL